MFQKRKEEREINNYLKIKIKNQGSVVHSWPTYLLLHFRTFLVNIIGLVSGVGLTKLLDQGDGVATIFNLILVPIMHNDLKKEDYKERSLGLLGQQYIFPQEYYCTIYTDFFFILFLGNTTTIVYILIDFCQSKISPFMYMVIELCNSSFILHKESNQFNKVKL